MKDLPAQLVGLQVSVFYFLYLFSCLADVYLEAQSHYAELTVVG